MPNLYATLSDIKSAGLLSITATTYDADLLDALEEGSRQIDRDTDRFFYIYEGTFYQDGGANRVILDWDVQTITTLKCDTDGDGAYESTYTVDMNNPTTNPDAFAYPVNTMPKTRLEANPWGTYGHFGAGIRKSIQIVGTFGHGNDWPTANTANVGTVLSASITSTATSLVPSTANILSTGMTLKINSEQLFVSEMNSTGSTATIVRAINGTAAASATTDTAISVYQYPKTITKAVLIYAIRIWKRRESAFQNQVGNPEMGTVTVWKGDDPDYQKAVLKYHKTHRGWYLK